MNIIVCVKQIDDPEAPAASFTVDPLHNTVIPGPGVSRVLSTFDEYAIEAALRIKEKLGGKVTALSLGMGLDRDVVKKPLSMGADELILLEDPAFVGGDSWSTAYALAQAINKIGQYDLILCGRQAADWDSGQVGLGIAEILGLPSVTIAGKVEIVDGKARVVRIIPDGFELIEVGLPAVFTVSNQHPTPRYPTVLSIMKANRIQPTVWKLADLGADPAKVGTNGRRIKLLKLCQPGRNATCEIVAGETPEEAATQLASKLREVKVL